MGLTAVCFSCERQPSEWPYARYYKEICKESACVFVVNAPKMWTVSTHPFFAAVSPTYERRSFE